MGQTDEKAIERKGKGRGKTTPTSQSAWAKARDASSADLTAIDPALIGSAVQAVAMAGAALMVSTTRDGGAVSITVFDNDEKERVYAHSSEEIEYVFRGLVEQYG